MEIVNVPECHGTISRSSLEGANSERRKEVEAFGNYTIAIRIERKNIFHSTRFPCLRWNIYLRPRIPLAGSLSQEEIPPEHRGCRRPCLWQRRRRFPESPKHPIDCSTSLAEPSWYTGHLPFTSCSSRYSTLSISVPPFLRSTLPSQSSCTSLSVCLSVSLCLSLSLSLFSPSTFTGGIRNGEHAAVQRLREPHATTPAPNHHPSFPRLCHAWCQPVWPPTRTTFSSFPPLTSLSLSSSLSFVLIHLLFFPSHATSRRCFFSLFSSSLPFFFIVRRGHLRHRLRLLPFVPLHRASPFSTGRVPSVCCYLCPSGSRIRASLTCMPVSYMSSASFHPPRRHHLSLLRPGFVRSFVRLLLPPLFVSKPSLSLSLSLSLASSLYYTRLV